MKKNLEAIEENYSIAMCNFEKIITLAKLIRELEYDGSDKKDILNLIQILNEQINLTYNEFKEIEISFL